MKNNIVYCFVLLLLFCSAFYGEEVPPGKVQSASDFTWENRKISFGLCLLCGVSYYNTNMEGFHKGYFIGNARVWMNPHLEISLESTLDINQSYIHSSYNIGYGNFNKNLYWHIGGGTGSAFIGLSILNPSFNINGGMEWLIFKNYSIGWKLQIGTIFAGGSTIYFIDLALSTNLVF